MAGGSSSKDAKKAREQAERDAAAARSQQQAQWEDQKAINAENKAMERMMRLQGLRGMSFDRERRAALRGTLGFRAFRGQGGNIGAYRDYAKKFAWGTPPPSGGSGGSGGGDSLSEVEKYLLGKRGTRLGGKAAINNGEDREPYFWEAGNPSKKAGLNDPTFQNAGMASLLARRKTGANAV